MHYFLITYINNDYDVEFNNDNDEDSDNNNNDDDNYNDEDNIDDYEIYLHVRFQIGRNIARESVFFFHKKQI